MEYIAPIAFVMIGAFFVYASYTTRRNENQVIAEFFFSIGGLLLLSAIFILFNSMDMQGDNTSTSVLPIFALLMWTYILLYIFIVFKLLMRVLLLAYETVKNYTRRK